MSRVIGCSDYLLLNTFYIDVLLEKIGILQCYADADEVYARTRVVLTKVDLHHELH